MPSLAPLQGSVQSSFQFSSLSSPVNATAAPAAQPPTPYRADSLQTSGLQPLAPAVLKGLFSQSSATTPTTQSTAPARITPPPSRPQSISHVVRQGDTLAALAQRYLGDAEAYPQIYDLNRSQMHNPNQLEIGMRLQIPVAQRPVQAVRPVLRPQPRPEDLDLNALPTYTVRRGDSLSSIALQHLGDSSKYQEIYNLNRDRLNSPNQLRINMTLRLPARTNQTSVQPPQQLPNTRPMPRPDSGMVAPQPAEPLRQPASLPQNSFEHLVQTGDSLSMLAQRYLGDSGRYMEIFEANRDRLSTPGRVRAGMALRIPGLSAAPETPVLGPVTTGAQELLEAMQNYQAYHAQRGHTNRTRSSAAQMQEIAQELDAASKAFGVDPKLMLALFAHESGGINPSARSHTGAGGLGQLTGIAIRQVHHLAGLGGQRGKAPYTQHSQKFVQRTNNIQQRFNIKRNIWTSVAYMRYELTDRAHLGRGVKNALKRYGDPNVASYADHVNREYRTLFGGRLF